MINEVAFEIWIRKFSIPWLEALKKLIFFFFYSFCFIFWLVENYPKKFFLRFFNSAITIVHWQDSR